MASKAQMNHFLAQIIPIAQAQAKKHGMAIYPSVCIAQAVHESGWGVATKMVKANALYGIKVGSGVKFGTAWKGAAYKTGTTEYYDGKTATRITDYFRAYDSVEDSTEDYMDMLCKASRYKGALNQASPEACIKGIIAGGYATGPTYVKSIMKLIDTYDLTQYDNVEDVEDGKGCPYMMPAISVKYTMVGNEVKWLQWMLNEAGANLSVDGIFGKKTLAAVEEFQRDHGLNADGIVGKLTKAEIMRVCG